MTVGYFVTGTDTEVGKTLVSAALLLKLRETHARVVVTYEEVDVTAVGKERGSHARLKLRACRR